MTVHLIKTLLVLEQERFRPQDVIFVELEVGCNIDEILILGGIDSSL